MAILNLRFPEGKNKVLTLSYDDGQVHDIRLAETLSKFGIKATFNINSGYWTSEDTVREKPEGKLKLSEAKRIHSMGHEIAVHGLTHASLWRISPTEAVYEIMEDRKNLEREFGVIVRGMAYPNGQPFGNYNDEVLSILKQCGICYARTTVATESYIRNFPPRNWLELPTTCHHNHPKLMELAESFVNTEPVYDQNYVFYLWGHSFEFYWQNNWEVIEKFAELTGNRPDVWYATNIELYDYVKAFERLQRSADGELIHNPTTTKLWVRVNYREDLMIEPDETINLRDRNNKKRI